MTDIITVEIIRNSLEYIAEEMGIVLRNSAYSPNIKERMDHSCAIFDSECRLLAHAEHIPVHLGAMPLGVKKALETIDYVEEGDMVVFNDPYIGGTHLPDITLVAPVFFNKNLIGYVANRAHHSDIGGKTPGSMPGDAIEIYEEGLVIPPVKLVRRGIVDRDILNIICSNARTPDTRKGDILAQIAANKRGINRIQKILWKYGTSTFIESVDEILNYSERLARIEISKLPRHMCEAVDYLDDGGPAWNKPIKIHVSVKIEGDNIVFDFTKSDDNVPSPVNATRAVTTSCVYYVFKCTIAREIPSNDGTYRPVRVITREGSIVDTKHPYAVSGGNVETSQRIVDVLFKALSKIIPDIIPAASQGTMNNISFGGMNPKTRKVFTFYETIGGGCGARPGMDGVDGVHTHMTNTMNTPIEEIERICPIMIEEYSLREDSCGAGRWRGGLGIVRKYRILAPMRVSLMGDRHRYSPWGLKGGKNGAPGEYILIRGSKSIRLGSKETLNLVPGDLLVIKTPGGGGHGDPELRDVKSIMMDIEEGKISKKYVYENYPQIRSFS